MKLNKKKIILSLGAVSIIAMPIVTVISCGDNNKNPPKKTEQDKMNDITKKMVSDAITSKLAPTPSKSIPSKPKDFTQTLNGLDKIIISIKDWNPQNTTGTVKMSTTISKTGLTTPPKFTDISISGFHILWRIKTTKGDKSIPSVQSGFSQQLDATHYLIGTNSQGVYQVTVGVDGMVKTSTQVSSATIPSVEQGFSQQLDATHYLIGTSVSGVYQVTVGADGMVKTSTQVPLVTIPSVSGGFSQKIDATHYLIGTDSKGVYQVTVGVDGIVKTSTQVSMSGLDSIPSVSGGFSQKIDATHYLIGTSGNNGVYQVTVGVDGIVKTSTQVSMSGLDSIPSVSLGFSQKIDATHYLIGTDSQGVYQVTVGADGMVTNSTQVPLVTIPDVNNGFSQQLDATHYLIGTSVSGVYQVTVGADGMVKTSTQVSMSGLDSIPSVSLGFSQKIDATHYLIGTNIQGVYQVTFDE